MCNRFRSTIVKAGKQLAEWGYEEFSDTRIQWWSNQAREEMYPDYPGLVARLDEGGMLVPDVMRWGFPPPPNGRQVVTNVRNTESPFWHPWLKPSQRCLVSVTEFAEPRKGEPDGNQWFKLTNDEPFCFAGIWRPWTGIRGTKADQINGEHRVFSFLTTDANDVMRPIHPKAMPVILRRSDFDQWLTGTTKEALELQRPLPNSDLFVIG
jgi:putative SOS response-associated peptidase YedK